VIVLGYVPDLNGQLNQSAVFVAPLRFSAGVQNKVLEAMAAGVAVVTTSDVNAGLAAVPEQEILVGDSAKELAEGIVRLLRDEQFRLRLGLAGRLFVGQRYSWQTAVERLRQIERELSLRRDDGFENVG
jgi:glycosyltransferase involved in cell wall biosynthesis